MKAVKRIEATAVSFPAPNVDTDQIIPARFLWHARADGYGQWLFHDLRFDEAGAGKPGFVLNEQGNTTAGILIADRNFGCGSSREQAVWALYDYGFRAVIAPSFGDIFYNNCCKQGLLPAVLPEPEIARLRAAIGQSPGALIVDLETQTIAGPDGFAANFEIAPFRRRQLLQGLDEIAMTLAMIETIGTFEAAFDRAMPWLTVVARSGGPCPPETPRQGHSPWNPDSG